jgi:hypothetical protein
MNFSKRKDKPMNKILSIIVVFVVSLSLTGVAAALPPRAPTTICFSTVENEFGSEFSLLIKPMGNIKMSGGPVVYSIQGVYFDPAIVPQQFQVRGIWMEVFFIFHLTLHIHSRVTPVLFRRMGIGTSLQKQGLFTLIGTVPFVLIGRLYKFLALSSEMKYRELNDRP